jgi:hypothetical protein
MAGDGRGYPSRPGVVYAGRDASPQHLDEIAAVGLRINAATFTVRLDIVGAAHQPVSLMTTRWLRDWPVFGVIALRDAR